MILKRTILSLCLIVGSVMLTCCTDLKFGADFLDKAPDGGMNKDSVFASRVYAERAVAEAYFALPFGLPYQSGSWGTETRSGHFGVYYRPRSVDSGLEP